MTPDQLLLLHRIMQMSPEEMKVLRENYTLYCNCVDKLRSVVGKQTNAECLAGLTDTYHNMSETYKAIARA